MQNSEAHFYFKGALCSAGEDFLIRREKYSLPHFFLCLNKLNNQTDLPGQHGFITVYMWRTLPLFITTYSTLGTLCPSEPVYSVMEKAHIFVLVLFFLGRE